MTKERKKECKECKEKRYRKRREIEKKNNGRNKESNAEMRLEKDFEIKNEYEK